MYKIITIVASNAEVLVEELETMQDINKRLDELNETNENFLEMQAYVLVLNGDIVKHNLKNIIEF